MRNPTGCVLLPFALPENMRIHGRFINIAGMALAIGGFPGAVWATPLAPDQQQEVIATCSPDAYRLCPQSMSSVSEVAICMRRKHSELSPTCRISFDKVVRILAQK